MGNLITSTQMMEIMRVSNCNKIGYLKGSDTHQGSVLFPVGSTIAMHEVIVEGKSTDDNEQSYIMEGTKMSRLITCNTSHPWKTPETREQYLR